MILTAILDRISRTFKTEATAAKFLMRALASRSTCYLFWLGEVREAKMMACFHKATRTNAPRRIYLIRQLCVRRLISDVRKKNGV
jgi:hypothetical protein